MAEQAMMPTLEDELQEELNDGATEDDFVVQQLRRQIAAKQSGKTFEQLYVSGSVNRRIESQ